MRRRLFVQACLAVGAVMGAARSVIGFGGKGDNPEPSDYSPFNAMCIEEVVLENIAKRKGWLFVCTVAKTNKLQRFENYYGRGKVPEGPYFVIQTFIENASPEINVSLWDVACQGTLPPHGSITVAVLEKKCHHAKHLLNRVLDRVDDIFIWDENGTLLDLPESDIRVQMARRWKAWRKTGQLEGGI